MPIYMKIDGIDGDVTVKGHENWFELQSYGWGAEQQGSSGGGGAGKVVFSDLSIVKSTGKGSPAIFLNCASGKHLKTVTLEQTRRRRDGEQVYLTITLTDVLVTSYQQNGDNGSIPFENVSFNFAQIKYVQKVQQADGSVKDETASWDIKRGGA